MSTVKKDATTCKLVLVGNGSIGKSSLCARFISDGFEKKYKQTVGIDFLEKVVNIRQTPVTLQVWDIGGQNLGSKMLNNYLTGISVAFLCYDITDIQSFHDMSDWLQVIRKTNENESNSNHKKVLIFLVGNKIDLEHTRQVKEEIHDKFILTNNINGGFFMSAKSGEHVMSSFYQAAAAYINVKLTENELTLMQKVLKADISGISRDEGRTKNAKNIEDEDAEYERKLTENGDNSNSNTNCCTIL